MKLSHIMKWLVGITLIVVFNIFCVGIAQTLTDVAPARYNGAILREPYQEYSFTPLFSHQVVVNTELPFLHVQTSPANWKYYFTWLREDWSYKNKSFEQLFLASKRISELSRWGNELAVLGNFVDMDQFQKFQSSNRPRVWKFIFNRFNGWEPTLARYMQFIDQEIESIEQEQILERKIERLSALQNFILAHKRDVMMIIYKLEKDDTEKVYLRFVVTQIFNIYEQYIAAHMPAYNPRTIQYAIHDIIQAQDEGIYDIHLDTYTQPLPRQADYALLYKGKTYNNAVQATDAGQSPYESRQSVFKDITIDATSREIILQISPIELHPTTPWKHHVNDEGDHVYSVDLPISRPNQRFFLDVTYRFTTPVTLQYAMVTTGKEYDERRRLRTVTHEDKFANVMLPPTAGTQHFQKHVDLINTRRDVLTRLSVVSQIPLASDTVDDVTVTMTPVYEPLIKLERIAYLPNKQPTITYRKIHQNLYEIKINNTSPQQEENIINHLGLSWKVIDRTETYLRVQFWPSTILIRVLMVIDFLLLMFLLQRTRIARLVHHLFLVIKRYLSKMQAFDTVQMKNMLYNALAYGAQYRLYILLTSIFSILSYVFLFKRDENEILPLLVLLWIIATAGYRIRSYIHFLFGLGFLIFAAATFIVQFDALSEKAAVWAYLFFFIGIIQAYIEYLLQPVHLLTLAEFKGQIAHDSRLLSLVLKELWQVIIYPAGIRIKKLIRDIYGPRPQTHIERVILAGKIGITILLLTLIVTSFIVIERRYTRSSFNPLITSVQPLLVYPDNKVVIKGQNFGWKQHERVRLRYQEGEIFTSFWTDAKIIFTVPLHWNPGEITIWIEKPTQWEGNMVIAKSQIQTLKLLPRGNTFTPDDDAYFQQLKELDKEVRTLNGYE